ncbi:nucleolar and spindle-associated protein 1-like [Oscarella lobularis]|uniref:nucleolar and spindle-associated protein 1-like n=1 Tax=Oscarella lobularis TaxID=121494 RepID=UPI003313CF57
MSEATESFDSATISTMKRPQLQKLCKRLKIKANGKNEEMKQKLIEYYGVPKSTPKSPKKSVLPARRQTFSVSPKKDRGVVKTKVSKIPRFTGIHERNFQRMESIEDYAKRKEERRQKMMNFTPKIKPKSAEMKSPKFNWKTPLKSPFAFGSTTKPKIAFDLKASLSRPLSYKPYKGKIVREDPKERKIDIKNKTRKQKAMDQKTKREKMIQGRRELAY